MGSSGSTAAKPDASSAATSPPAKSPSAKKSSSIEVKPYAPPPEEEKKASPPEPAPTAKSALPPVTVGPRPIVIASAAVPPVAAAAPPAAASAAAAPTPPAPQPAAPPPAASAASAADIDWTELEQSPDPVPGLLAAIRDHKDNAAVVLKACQILQGLSQSGVHRQKIYDSQGIDVVIEAVVAHKSDATMQDAAMTLLTVLCALGKVRQRMLQDLPTCATVTEVIKLNKPHAEVQIAAYRFLEKLLLKNVKHQKLRRLGLIDAVLDALEAHLGNSGVVVAAYAILWTLAESEKKKDSIGTVQGLKAIIGAMEKHRQSANLQLQACRLLKKIALGGVDDNQQHRNAVNIAANGGFAAVVDAIQTHMNNDKLLKKALKVFLRAGSQDEAVRTKVGETKNFEVILKVLGQYKGDTALLSRALDVLSLGVKNNPDCSKRLQGASAVPATFEILRIHKKNEQLVSRCCAFLADLCDDNESAKLETVAASKGKAVGELLAIAELFSNAKESDGLFHVMRVIDEISTVPPGLAALQQERPQMQLLLTALAFNRSLVTGGREDFAMANRLADALELEGFKM